MAILKELPKRAPIQVMNSLLAEAKKLYPRFAPLSCKTGFEECYTGVMIADDTGVRLEHFLYVETPDCSTRAIKIIIPVGM